MTKTRKTKEEKVRAQYRLKNFSLQVKEVAERKDREEFGYLATEYIVKDLSKTLIYTLLVVGLLILAKLKLQ